MVGLSGLAGEKLGYQLPGLAKGSAEGSSPTIKCRSKSHTTSVGWELCLTPLEVIERDTQDTGESFACNLVKAGQEVSVGGGVDRSEDEHELWEGEA